MGVKWRGQEDAFSRLAREDREEYLRFFSGCLVGVVLSAVLWIALTWAVVVVYFD